MTSPALPYAEPSRLDDVYADAASLAPRYPVHHLPAPEPADLPETAQGWRRIAADITSETDLGELYGE